MPDAQASLLLIVLQIGLIGLTWACLAVYVHEARPVIFRLIGYTFVAGAGLAMVSLPDVMDRPVLQSCRNFFIVSAPVLLSQGGLAMWSVRLPRLVFVRVPLVGMAVMLWFNVFDRHVFVAATALLGTIAWILVASPCYIFRHARQEFGAAVAWVLLLSGVAVAVGQLVLLAQAWRSGVISDIELNRSGRFGSWAILLSAIYASNLAFAFALVTRLVRKLAHLSSHDALTGLLNRRAMMEAVEQEWERHRRHGMPFTLLALDIDDFKRINDGHGHPMGDEVLRRMGAILGRTMRRSDRVGRTGGEEFIVMLVGSDAASAAGLAELLRCTVAKGPWPPELASQSGVTVSIGLAAVDPADRLVADLLSRADCALYQAKAGGRNRVVASVAAAAAPGLPPAAGRSEDPG